MTRKRILFVEPEMNPPGGAQCLAVWALQGLQDKYSIDLLTWNEVDFEEVNRFYGTRLDKDRFKRTWMPAWVRRLVSLDPDPWSFQRIAILMRIAKLRRAQYDLLISFADEMEFGDPVIQYIHFPWMSRIYRREKYLSSLAGWKGRLQFVLHRYRPWRVIAGFSFERMLKNVTLVNSDWTGRRFRQEYNVEPIVLYPPVPGEFPPVPWSERENGFVCIGRISGEKKYEVIISILSRVRARGHAIHLHIVGKNSGQSDSDVYYQKIRELMRQNADWISFEENISRNELTRLITSHRYGIHGMEDEHFGIAVAELVRGGCVVFVPNDGGQVEIVGKNERLCYNSPEDAVVKVAQVLEDADIQHELQTRLAERAEQLSTQQFQNKLNKIVENALDKQD
jgi:glycosyltransferase involved in cell wall biosynthesis